MTFHNTSSHPEKILDKLRCPLVSVLETSFIQDYLRGWLIPIIDHCLTQAPILLKFKGGQIGIWSIANFLKAVFMNC